MRRGPPALFLVLGALLLIGATWAAVGTVSFTRQAARASGTIVTAGAGGRHPHIAFRTAAGQVVQFQAGGLIAPVEAGQAVPMLYAAQDPATTARIGWLVPLFFMPAIVGVIGAVFLAMALLALSRRSL